MSIENEDMYDRPSDEDIEYLLQQEADYQDWVEYKERQYEEWQEEQWFDYKYEDLSD